MTEEEKKLLNTFEARLRQFMFVHEELLQENEALKQQISEKNDEILKLEGSYNELKATYANLKIARILSLHDQDIEETKQRLSKLVREVDKCIALLNE